MFPATVVHQLPRTYRILRQNPLLQRRCLTTFHAISSVLHMRFDEGRPGGLLHGDGRAKDVMIIDFHFMLLRASLGINVSRLTQSVGGVFCLYYSGVWDRSGMRF